MAFQLGILAHPTAQVSALKASAGVQVLKLFGPGNVSFGTGAAPP